MKRHAFPAQPENGVYARYCIYCHLGEWFVGDTECRAAPDSPDPPAPSRVIRLIPRPEPPPAPSEEKWSPLELLEEFVAEIKAGKINPVSLMVSFIEQEPSGNRRPHSWRANVSYAEAIAYATLEIHKAIEDWRKP